MWATYTYVRICQGYVTLRNTYVNWTDTQHHSTFLPFPYSISALFSTVKTSGVTSLHVPLRPCHLASLFPLATTSTTSPTSSRMRWEGHSSQLLTLPWHILPWRVAMALSVLLHNSWGLPRTTQPPSPPLHRLHPSGAFAEAQGRPRLPLCRGSPPHLRRISTRCPAQLPNQRTSSWSPPSRPCTLYLHKLKCMLRRTARLAPAVTARRSATRTSTGFTHGRRLSSSSLVSSRRLPLTRRCAIGLCLPPPTSSR